MTLPAVLPGLPPVVVVGENTAEAARQAERAEAAAATLGSLDADAISSAVYRINLLDPDAVTDDYFVNHTTGALNANASYWASDFMPVEEGESYHVTYKHYRAWYNSDQVFISGASDTGENATITAPAGAAYLRLSALSSRKFSTFRVVKGTSFPSGGYIPYSQVVDGAKLLRGSVSADAIAANELPPTKFDFLTVGKNLFDKNAATADSFAGSSGAVGSSATYVLSDYIEVEPGETYYGAGATLGMRFWTAYDERLAVVPASGSDDGGNTITVPASGVKYYRVTLYTSNLDSFQFEKSASQTAYEPFRYSFDYRINTSSSGAASSAWSGKAFLSYGDSLVAQGEWQPEVASEMGLLHTSAGEGGRRISGSSGMWVQATIDALPADQDLIIVLGGTNDWAQNVPLGTFKTVTGSGATSQTVLNTDTDEFYGALNVMIERLQTKYPEARICLACPPWSELPSRVTDSAWAEDFTNQQGLTSNDYGDASAIVAKHWGLPLIDFRESGINKVNNETYMKNDGGWLHPNSTHGGPRLAEVVIGRLRDIEPLS